MIKMRETWVGGRTQGKRESGRWCRPLGNAVKSGDQKKGDLYEVHYLQKPLGKVVQGQRGGRWGSSDFWP